MRKNVQVPVRIAARAFIAIIQDTAIIVLYQGRSVLRISCAAEGTRTTKMASVTNAGLRVNRVTIGSRFSAKVTSVPPQHIKMR